MDHWIKKFFGKTGDNNDIFRKAGGNFNMMLIWWIYGDFTQNGLENRQKTYGGIAGIESSRYVVFTHISLFYMKQIGTKQFNSNDVMSLHRDMTAVKTLNETRVQGVISGFDAPSLGRHCFA